MALPSWALAHPHLLGDELALPVVSKAQQERIAFELLGTRAALFPLPLFALGQPRGGGRAGWGSSCPSALREGCQEPPRQGQLSAAFGSVQLFTAPLCFSASHSPTQGMWPWSTPGWRLCRSRGQVAALRSCCCPLWVVRDWLCVAAGPAWASQLAAEGLWCHCTPKHPLPSLLSHLGVGSWSRAGLVPPWPQHWGGHSLRPGGSFGALTPQEDFGS